MTQQLISAMFVAIGIFNFASPVCASNEGDSMNTQQVNNFLATGKFEHIKKKADMPKVWWNAMDLVDTSDVGGPFDPGCTGPAPHCRLITAAISPPYAVVVEEQGGIVYWKTLIVYKQNKGAISRVYSETGLSEARLKEIRARLEHSAQ